MTPGKRDVPEAIGGCTIDSLIGSGGQSDVFALKPVPGQPPLALKRSKESFTPPWLDPLALEYRTLCRLCHPQLVGAYDFGYDKGRAFMVIERVDGPGLCEGLPRDTVASLVELMRAVGPVISFLHRRGVVHRDLKPANFRWSAPTQTQPHVLHLLDLGLVSRPRDPAKEGRAGTLCYMAPEVLKEGRVDARSDLYSLGIILYEWLTGAPPFVGPGPAEIINGHLSGTIHWPGEVVARIGSELVDVIGLLLKKDPQSRPKNIEETITLLARAGLPIEPSFIEATNLPWHIQATRRNCLDLELPVETPVETPTATARSTWIFLVGDPGSGTAEVLQRWEQELKIRGWSAANDGLTLRASMPGVDGVSLTVSTSGDPTVVEAAKAEVDDFRQLALRPMGEGEVAEYLHDILFDTGCVHELTPVALRLSSGLPGALDMLITEWTNTGVVRWDGETWVIVPSRLDEVVISPRLQQVYNRVVEKMTTPQIRALNIAAVFGVHLSTQVLADLLDNEGIPRRTLDELFAHDFLIPWREPDEPLVDARFRLMGLPEVWAADLPPEHRRALHAAIAAALNERRGQWGARVDRRLAHHLWEAGNLLAARDAAIRWAECNADAEHGQEAHRFLDLAEAATARLEEDLERDTVRAHIAILRGRTYQTSGVIEDAQRCFRGVLALTRKTNDLRLQAEAAKNLGDTYTSTRRHARGERILRIALMRFQKLGDEVEISHTLNNLGNIAWVRGEIDRGLDYYHHALELQRKLGRTADVASTLSNIGAMYLGKYEFAWAKTCMLESLKLKETLDQPGEVARTLNNLGLASLYAGEFDPAIEYFTRAAAINQAEGALDHRLLNGRNLLDAWLSQAAYRRVIEEAPALLRLAEELEERVNRAYIHLFAARAFHELADYRSSREHLDRMADLVDRVNDSTLLGQYFILLAERRLRFGDHEGCLRALGAAREHAGSSSDVRDRAEVYVAAAKAERELPDIPPDFYAAAVEAHRLFEKLGLTHRLFEVLLVADDDSLSGFLTQFPLPDGFASESPIRYTGPPAQEGLWLWRLGQKTVAEGDHPLALRLFTALVGWGEAQGARELAWRAHAQQGVLYHRARDWELAARAFGTAVQILDAIAATIDAPTEREAYLAGKDVQRLYNELAAFSGRFVKQ